VTYPDIRYVRGVTDAGKTRAAPAVFPYPGHGTMALIMEREDRLRESLAKARSVRRRR
jgi:hypothetical protein